MTKIKKFTLYVTSDGLLDKELFNGFIDAINTHASTYLDGEVHIEKVLFKEDNPKEIEYWKNKVIECLNIMKLSHLNRERENIMIEIADDGYELGNTLYEIWYSDEGADMNLGGTTELRYRFRNKDLAYKKLKELNDNVNWGRPYYIRAVLLDG